MESHAKDVQSQVNTILAMIIDAGAGLVVSEFAKSKKVKERYGKQVDHAKDAYGKLIELVKGHPEEEQSVKRIGDLNSAIGRVLKHARQDSEDDNKIGLVRDFGQLQSLMIDFSGATGEITSQQKEIEKARSRARVRARYAVINALGFGLFFNVALAIGLAVYFNRGTASRMIILMDNTRRLAKGEQLNPPIGGKDEIAHLDRTFNEMAEALEQASRKERAIIANARDVICSLDHNFIFTAVNPASSQVWGYASDELLGKGLEAIVPEDALSALKDSFTKIGEGDVDLPAESRIQCHDGKEIEMLWSVQWSKQEATFFCVAHDITERKQIERMKREFVAMVSHDLRTPLTSIQGFLSLLEAGVYGELSDSGIDSLSVADNSITRLVKLINDLLDIERLESGKFDLQISNVSVEDIFEQSADAVETFAQQQGVAIVNQPEQETHEDIHLQADGDRLIQVLVNLLSNAIKFSPAGSKVTLAAELVDDLVEFKIIDEGRGIPADFIDSVFERFKQVKKSDAKNKKGTGLGLAICKSIVEKHGGTIGVTSEEGKGSTFWFRVPKKADA